MKIETTRFGILDIDESKIIIMPKGIPGFPSRKRFIMFKHREDSPFYWYQCVDDGSLAFVIISPFIIKPDYSININQALNEMKWKDPLDKESIEIYVIVTIPKGQPDKITANLIAPLLINTRRREAGQVIFSDTPYSHRYPIMPRKENRQYVENNG